MSKLDSLLPIIEAHLPELKQPGVISIRPGYKLENDWPTSQPAIVVITSKGAGKVELPQQVGGIPVDAREATDVEQVRYQKPQKYAVLAAQHPELNAGAFREFDPDAEAGVAEVEAAGAPELMAAKPHIEYTGPEGVSLQSVTGKISVLCHASPDAGSPQLKKFVSETQETLTVGLYDFTSEHILDCVKASLGGGKKLEITLDNPALNPTADQSDPATLDALKAALGYSLSAAWALVRSNKDIQQWIFPNAYHIKVAVRDSEAVWLSSGNWNNSNQPDIDPISTPGGDDQATARKSDRDWHVIIENRDLAGDLEAYLKHDYEVASTHAPVAGPGVAAATPAEAVPESFRGETTATWTFFKPLSLEEDMTITPLLTPDKGVYTSAMLNLLNSADEKLYIQLQYIHPPREDQDPEFADLIGAVTKKIGDGKDVKIILSQYQTSHGWLERLQEAGISLDNVKIQNGVHNKGFLVDSKIVALGSQNWSGDGVLRNRDASVIIENRKAAGYYEEIFLHDWDNIARKSVRS
jgi:phosphatidylserine/phosphatidylglycerophosphate/cardiolipin synthase-like enzyme